MKQETTLDDILDIKETVFLERRLQTIVVRKGLAQSMKQARQLITHGFIAIEGRKVKSPGYMVTTDEETKIGYYKPIDLNPIQSGKTVETPAQAKEEPKPVAEKKEGD